MTNLETTIRRLRSEEKVDLTREDIVAVHMALAVVQKTLVEQCDVPRDTFIEYQRVKVKPVSPNANRVQHRNAILAMAQDLVAWGKGRLS